MSVNLRSLIGAQLGWTWRDRDGSITITNSNRLEFRQELADGAQTNQADGVWNAEDQALPAGGSATLELDALEKSLFGEVIYISLLSVKAILIVNNTTSEDGCLVVGGAAASPWPGPFGTSNDTIKVMPGGALLLAAPRAGWAVEVGATDLKLAAPGDGVTFDIAILGTISAPGGGSSSSGI